MRAGARLGGAPRSVRDGAPVRRNVGAGGPRQPHRIQRSRPWGARRTPHYHRAEVWYDRASRLAARFRNRREKIRALIGYGGLLRELGRHDEARELFLNADRLARSTRRHRQAAELQHELLATAAESGGYEEAEHYMLAALRDYPQGHEALPWLAHDWAFFLLRLNRCEEARGLLEAIRPCITRPELQVIVEGALGRALAGCGLRDEYDGCTQRVLSLIAEHEEYAAAALAHLAAGAAFFSDWVAAEHLALRAVDSARAWRQESVERGALEILASIRQHRSANLPASQPDPRRLSVIQHQMLARLREGAPSEAGLG
jgi:tetratricopeptide (TPR) repeat protein